MIRVAIGAACGVFWWVSLSNVVGTMPVWLRFLLTGQVFLFGPGALVAAPLLKSMPMFTRNVVALSFGVALAPLLGHLLGMAGALAAFPYVCGALTGGVIAYWFPWHWPSSAGTGRDRVAALVLVVVALGMGTVAFANRLTTTREATTVYGDYDSYDLTYYAAIAGELSHTVPPASPFFNGRMLNHGFYPHVLLSMIHRFGEVPLLDVYFRYAWPAFLALLVLMCFVFMRTLATTQTAFVTALLLMVGGNFAYLAKWLFRPEVWDEVIWAHNVQGATAEPLLYNNWTPALIAMFAALYALHRSMNEPGRLWPVLAGVTLATTILAKPWVFAAVLAALAMSTLLSWRTPAVRRSALLALAAAVVAGAPLLYRTMTLFEDSQVVFEPAFFPIPIRMAERVGLRDWFLEAAASLGLSGATQLGAASMMAAPLFLVASFGYRLVGLRALWGSLRGRSEAFIWRVLAWTVIAALGASTVIVSVPYHEITQVHQFVLFCMTMFVGKSLASWVDDRKRMAVIVLVVALAVPCTIVFLHRKWTDGGRPLVSASAGEIRVAAILAGTDPAGTALLHDRPDKAFLIGILAARRSVVSWAPYVRGSEQRRHDAETFFVSPDLETAREILRRYRPTHVIEHENRDHLNADVRGQLEFVSRNDGVVLYRVPEALLR
jgi:hypothetical protein